MRIDFRRALALDRSDTRITHRIEISRPCAGPVGLLLGRNLAKGLPAAVGHLARVAEEGAR